MRESQRQHGVDMLFKHSTATQQRSLSATCTRNRQIGAKRNHSELADHGADAIQHLCGEPNLRQPGSRCHNLLLQVRLLLI